MSGFTVSSLTNYVIENENKIYSAAILGAETIKNGGITVQAGIKSSEQINLLSNTAPFQADGGCAFAASGSTTFTQRQLTVSKLKWQDVFCPDDLEAKYTSKKLTAGSNYETMPFEQEIMDLVISNINAQMEQAIWQGNTTSHLFSTNLKQFNGFIQVLEAAGTATYATATAAITTGNIIGIMDDIYSIIPAPLLNSEKGELVAFMGWDTFRKLLIAEKNSNAYHYGNVGDMAKTGTYTMPGSGLKVKAVHGLDNITGTLSTYKDRIVCTYPSNLIYGTDLANEYEEAKIWYSADDQNIKGSIKWKAGVQIAFPAEVISYKNS